MRIPTVLILCALGACGACGAVASAAGPDTDGDGVADSTDNCRLEQNPSQLDADGDGWGNRCDADFDNSGGVNVIDLAILREAFFTNDPLTDLNADGVVNVIDLAIIRNLFFEPPGPAGYAQWNSATGGDWADPANWFPAAVPPAGAAVTIDLAASEVVRFTGESAVAGIDSSATLLLESGQLAVNGVLATHTLEWQTGTLVNARVQSDTPVRVTRRQAAAQGVTLESDLDIDNGAHLNVSGGLVLDNADIWLNSTGSASFLLFDGQQTLGGVGRVVFGGTVQFENSNRVYQTQPGATLTIGPGIELVGATAGGRVGFSEGGRVVLEGIASFGVADRELAFEAPFENNGTIDVFDGGTLSLNGPWINRGTITVTDGGFRLDGDGPTQDLGVIDLTNTSAQIQTALSSAQLSALANAGPMTVMAAIDNTGSVLNTDDFPGGFALMENGGLTGGQLTGSVPLTVTSPVSSFSDETLSPFLDGVATATDIVIEATTLRVLNGLTLMDADVVLSNPVGTVFSARLSFVGSQTLAGSGEIRRVSPADSNRSASITIGPAGSELVVESDISVRHEPGIFSLFANDARMVFEGDVWIAPGSALRLTSQDFVFNDSFTLASTLDDGASVLGSAADVTFGDDSMLNLELGPSLSAGLSLRTVSVGGTFNIAFVEGAALTDCDTLDLLTYTTNGISGQWQAIVVEPIPLRIRERRSATQIVGAGTCPFELTDLRGTTLSVDEPSDTPEWLNDGFRFLRWCETPQDGQVEIELQWPGLWEGDTLDVRNVRVASIEVSLFDADDALVFSGTSTPGLNTDLSLNVPAGQGAQRLVVRADAAPDGQVCIGEIDVFGEEQ